MAPPLPRGPGALPRTRDPKRRRRRPPPGGDHDLPRRAHAGTGSRRRPVPARPRRAGERIVTARPPAAGERREDDPRTGLDALLELGVRAATAYGRPLLAERLERRRRRLADERARVVLLGEYKAGKSSLVNALVGIDLCPVDDDIATGVPTIVRAGPEPSAALIDIDDLDRRQPVPFADREAVIRESPDDEGGRRAAVEIRLDHSLLRRGLELIDTPGVGGLDSAHTAAAVASLDDADAVLFVTDASQELTAAELDVLHRAVDRCADVAVIVTKIDLFPHWRRIVELDEGHLGDAGLELPVFPTSAALRRHALERDDPGLDAESGYVDVLTMLVDDVVDQVAALAADRAIDDLLAAIDEMIADFEDERRAIDDPAVGARLEEQVAEARARVERLTEGAARWQTVLADGINDLANDLDHDLRRRIRDLTAEAGERLDELDPAQSWDEFSAWLEKATGEAVVANQALLRDRSAALLEEVSRHFDAETDLELAIAEVAPTATAGADKPRTEGPGLVKQVIGGLRGSYSGLMMFGMLGSMAGIAVATPVLAGLGLLLGARQLRDERSRVLKAHRQQAQVSVRKYLDQVSFEVTKANRDHVKQIQRRARDHFGARVGELRERVARARAVLDELAANGNPESRRADIEAELGRLRRLRGLVEERV
ncbi:MAG: hypothetical protein D6683_01315 [Actinomyces sp.]|nr:MAG: hypothetical protein D6683_01315 [Actinomyces sp.]